ncbi:MAG TPA: ion channel [Bacillales bacterium]|nr:ion channel [Bacillales bacterium]
MWIVKRLMRKALRLSSWSIVVASLIVVFGATFAAYAIEPETFKTPFDAFWWVMTTVTTVGYGDFYPHTTAGRIVGIFLFVFGVGLVGVTIGKIVDAFGAFHRRREEGKLAYKGKGHIVIIGWSRKAEHALNEILSSNEMVDVVIIDTLEKAPLMKDRLHYVQGEASEERALEQANLREAKAVLIFADDTISEPQICDGKSLMIVTAVEEFAPHVHTVVEVMDEKHIENFHYVDVDEFILMHQTISRLAVRSAFMSGISEVYRQLMSRQHGDNLYRITNRSHWKTYGDAFNELLKEGATLVADRSDLNINRRLEEALPAEAELYVLCDGKTYGALMRKAR